MIFCVGYGSTALETQLHVMDICDQLTVVHVKKYKVDMDMEYC